MRTRLKYAFSLAVILLCASPCYAKKGLSKLFNMGDQGAAASGGLVWGFFPVEFLLGILAMPIGALLASIIAYHPLRVGEIGLKQEERERPKALILITVAGVIVGALVYVHPSMALALFGFGSFIRFRTQVKNPKETVIIFLCAGIGCLCGLRQFYLAIAATTFVYILIWILDRTSSGDFERVTLVLKGLGAESQVGARIFKEKLTAAGVEVLSSKVSLKKGNVTLLLKKDVRRSTDEIEEILLSGEGPRPRSLQWIRT